MLSIYFCIILYHRAPQDEDTPLHLAASCGRAVVVAQLLAAGADRYAKNAVRGGYEGRG